MKKIIIYFFFIIFSKTVFADSKMDLGFEIYNNKAQCGVCHTLQNARSTGDIGPNLDPLKPTSAYPKSSTKINIILGLVFSFLLLHEILNRSKIIRNEIFLNIVIYVMLIL